ncbi:MAG TPA: nucleotidyltransferase domain-containing protein [Stellaceae bacterium]|nr:nucleotidyltransferase domain-containing protein [Stellaceae bacterium]
MGELAKRRSQTAARLDRLRGKLKTAQRLASGVACVYATGSFGRGEAGRHSDLDLFILGMRDGKPDQDGKEGSLLSHLDEICIVADLIAATRRLGIPDFSDDGRYVAHFSVHDLTKTLGMPEDDATNTLTARLLLLLESCPVLGSAVYRRAVREVLDAYWRDFSDHRANFIPAFLANDILRLWRTFCVNYEARSARVPKVQKAKGKLKNYKLKHSRLLTCFSALLYLLAVYRRRGTVTPDDALLMIKLTPTERLEWLWKQPYLEDARPAITALLEQYERFLETTRVDSNALVRRFTNRKTGSQYLEAANTFGDAMFEALHIIGGGSRFHRLLVV